MSKRIQVVARAKSLPFSSDPRMRAACSFGERRAVGHILIRDPVNCRCLWRDGLPRLEPLRERLARPIGHQEYLPPYSTMAQVAASASVVSKSNIASGFSSFIAVSETYPRKQAYRRSTPFAFLARRRRAEASLSAALWLDVGASRGGLALRFMRP